MAALAALVETRQVMMIMETLQDRDNPICRLDDRMPLGRKEQAHLQIHLQEVPVQAHQLRGTA